MLAIKNADARALVTRIILRLRLQDQRPLLVMGAKVVGLLLDIDPCLDLRKVLALLGGSEDPAVRSEGLYQFALLRLADALDAQDHPALIASLESACEAFRTAEASEES